MTAKCEGIKGASGVTDRGAATRLKPMSCANTSPVLERMMVKHVIPLWEPTFIAEHTDHVLEPLTARKWQQRSGQLGSKQREAEGQGRPRAAGGWVQAARGMGQRFTTRGMTKRITDSPVVVYCNNEVF
jgi:hypothetical protein